MVPGWLTMLSQASLALGVALALVVIIDEIRRPQPMAIMNVVWPITALYGSVLGLWLYLRIGRAPPRDAGGDHQGERPFAEQVAISTAHCGGGCTLGDLVAEWLAVSFPAIALWFGYQTLFADKIFAIWILDFILAFALGVLFQYFAIKPMSDQSGPRVVIEALKADSMSLIAWQVGMYGFMAVATFVLWPTLFGVRLEADSWTFWFMMQIAMLCGFATSYPANWWLVRAGIKEAM